jgi:hypothetical protein
MQPNSDLIDLLRALNAERAEYLTTIDGVAFERAVHKIGREDFIANKEAAGRPQDRADVAYLRENEG